MEDLQQLVSNLRTFNITEYCQEDSMEVAVVYTLILGTICFILTKITTQYSWVDRIWSIIPVLYAYLFMHHQKTCRQIDISTRQYVMASLTTLWGIRLTYNFYRKGGYRKGGQDYRWIYIRQKFHWILVEILNFVFTAYYQLILIMWFSSPIVNAYKGQFGLSDYAATALWLLAFIGEITADEQQWTFQTQKYRLLKESNNNREKLPQEYKVGFFKGGLFRYSRHPNFFCEISIWYIQFLFSFNSVGWNYCGLGAVLLNLLFLGSTTLTEKISTEKYPEYNIYRQQTSMLIPLPYSARNKKQ